jgi:hypothetical protein
MADITVRRAELIELLDDFSDVKPNGVRAPVQFNPETLKLTYSNQIQSQPNAAAAGGSSPGGTGNQSQPARQFVGQGTTKLSLQLWFDVSAATEDAFMVDDVRRLTAKVLYFMQPRDPDGGNNNASQRVPPGVRFTWGTFLFDGIIESIEESVEFFSPEGKALRASVALGLVQQSIWVRPGDSGRVNNVNRVPGTQPLRSAQGGQNLQQLAGGSSGSGSPGSALGSAPAAGLGIGGTAPVSAWGARSWQRVAVNNGIENPRSLEPGQLIDLSAARARIITE